MPTERVIACDPGGRTGWASATMGLNSIEHLAAGATAQGSFARHLADMQAVIGPPHTKPGGQPVQRPLSLLTRYYDMIVYETWVPRPQQGSMEWIKGDRLLSAQHVGQIRLIAKLSGAKLVAQPPKAKTPGQAFIDSTRWGVEFSAMQGELSEQHGKDALMHLALYYAENWWSP